MEALLLTNLNASSFQVSVSLERTLELDISNLVFKAWLLPPVVYALELVPWTLSNEMGTVVPSVSTRSSTVSIRTKGYRSRKEAGGTPNPITSSILQMSKLASRSNESPIFPWGGGIY